MKRGSNRRKGRRKKERKKGGWKNREIEEEGIEGKKGSGGGEMLE
jgi:hypothetical protein